jgi:hypothetical protein
VRAISGSLPHVGSARRRPSSAKRCSARRCRERSAAGGCARRPAKSSSTVSTDHAKGAGLGNCLPLAEPYGITPGAGPWILRSSVSACAGALLAEFWRTVESVARGLQMVRVMVAVVAVELLGAHSEEARRLPQIGAELHLPGGGGVAQDVRVTSGMPHSRAL